MEVMAPALAAGPGYVAGTLVLLRCCIKAPNIYMLSSKEWKASKMCIASTMEGSLEMYASL